MGARSGLALLLVVLWSAGGTAGAGAGAGARAALDPAARRLSLAPVRKQIRWFLGDPQRAVPFLLGDNINGSWANSTLNASDITGGIINCCGTYGVLVISPSFLNFQSKMRYKTWNLPWFRLFDRTFTKNQGNGSVEVPAGGFIKSNDYQQYRLRGTYTANFD